MGTDDFHDISNEFGLDSQSNANYFKAFASYIEIPKKKWNKYHAPYKDVVNHVPVRSTQVYTTNHIIPEHHVEKMPFPAKVKEYSMIISANNKGTMKTVEPGKHLSDEPVVARVKHIVTRNIEDEHIVFCEDASDIISHPSKARKASVHALSIKIGDHCYYGLCDIGASSSVIPYELYRKIMHEIGPCELEDIDVVIH